MRKVLSATLALGLLFFWDKVILLWLPFCVQVNSLLHFLGGLTVAWVAVTFFDWKSQGFRNLDIFIRMAATVGAGASVAVLWEAFEYFVIGASALGQGEAGCVSLYDDTVRDLVMSFGGAVIASVLYEIGRDKNKNTCQM